MEFVIGILVGGLIGGFICWLFIGHKKPSGKIIIDFRDGDRPPLTLRLEEHIDDIYQKKSIMLKVETHDYKSQD